MRNLVYASVSVNFAQSKGIADIVVGNKTDIYREGDPYSFKDCSIGFYSDVSSLVSKYSEDGIRPIRFIMPLIADRPMTKAEVFKVILGVGIDPEMVWSCYSPTPAGYPCGVCYHCEVNRDALKEL